MAENAATTDAIRDLISAIQDQKAATLTAQSHPVDTVSEGAHPMSPEALSNYATAAQAIYNTSGALVELGNEIYSAFGSSGNMVLAPEVRDSLYRERLDENGGIVHDEDILQMESTEAMSTARSGQQFIQQIPIAGQTISDIGGSIYGFASATKNFVGGKGFESDQSYAQRELEEAQATENHTEILKEQTNLRQRINRQLESEAQEALHGAQTAGLLGPARDIADLDFRRQQIEQKYLQAQYHVGFKAEAPLTDEAIIAKRADIAEAAAKKTQAMNASNVEYSDLQNDIRIAQARSVGKTDDAQLEQFEHSVNHERKELRSRELKGSGVVEAFDEKAAVEKQELLQDQTKKRQFMASESARAIGDIQGGVHEVQLRAAGNAYAADRDQFIRTGEDKVKILREQSAAADDAAVKTQLLAQAEAQVKANAQELAAMDSAHQRQQDSAPAADSHEQKKQRAQQEKLRQQAFHREQLQTLQANANASGLGAVGQYEGLREDLIGQQEADAKDPGKLSADRANAAARIREFAAQARNAGAGQVLSAQQYADALGTSILHGGGMGQALGMASADLKTLGLGGNLSGDLSVVGQKLSSAADKWNHIADQMRNVTILTMGR
jgi:hypothetical protein